MFMDLIIHSIRIIYPLFQSFKVLKNKDRLAQQGVLKYWCINWMISLLDVVLEIALNDFIVNIVLVAFALALVYDHFHYSQVIFNKTIQPLIQQNEKKIESFFNFVDNQVKSIWRSASTNVEHVAKEKIGEAVADQFKKK